MNVWQHCSMTYGIGCLAAACQESMERAYISINVARVDAVMVVSVPFRTDICASTTVRQKDRMQKRPFDGRLTGVRHRCMGDVSELNSSLRIPKMHSILHLAASYSIVSLVNVVCTLSRIQIHLPTPDAPAPFPTGPPSAFLANNKKWPGAIAHVTQARQRSTETVRAQRQTGGRTGRDGTGHDGTFYYKVTNRNSGLGA